MISTWDRSVKPSDVRPVDMASSGVGTGWLQTLLGLEEISYFVMFGYLAVAGPGPVSVDHFIRKATRKDRSPADYGA